MRREWEVAHPGPYDDERYEVAILPLLKALTIPAISEATGLTIAYAAQIRAGKVPHPASWETLAKLAGIELHPTELPAEWTGLQL
jgi:hypothetical protein